MQSGCAYNVTNDVNKLDPEDSVPTNAAAASLSHHLLATLHPQQPLLLQPLTGSQIPEPGVVDACSRGFAWTLIGKWQLLTGQVQKAAVLASRAIASKASKGSPWSHVQHDSELLALLSIVAESMPRLDAAAAHRAAQELALATQNVGTAEQLGKPLQELCQQTGLCAALLQQLQFEQWPGDVQLAFLVKTVPATSNWRFSAAVQAVQLLKGVCASSTAEVSPSGRAESRAVQLYSSEESLRMSFASKARGVQASETTHDKDDALTASSTVELSAQSCTAHAVLSALHSQSSRPLTPLLDVLLAADSADDPCLDPEQAARQMQNTSDSAPIALVLQLLHMLEQDTPKSEQQGVLAEGDCQADTHNGNGGAAAATLALDCALLLLVAAVCYATGAAKLQTPNATALAAADSQSCKSSQHAKQLHCIQHHLTLMQQACAHLPRLHCAVQAAQAAVRQLAPALIGHVAGCVPQYCSASVTLRLPAVPATGRGTVSSGQEQSAACCAADLIYALAAGQPSAALDSARELQSTTGGCAGLAENVVIKAASTDTCNSCALQHSAALHVLTSLPRSQHDSADSQWLRLLQDNAWSKVPDERLPCTVPSSWVMERMLLQAAETKAATELSAVASGWLQQLSEAHHVVSEDQLSCAHCVNCVAIQLAFVQLNSSVQSFRKRSRAASQDAADGEHSLESNKAHSPSVIAPMAMDEWMQELAAGLAASSDVAAVQTDQSKQSQTEVTAAGIAGSFCRLSGQLPFAKRMCRLSASALRTQHTALAAQRLRGGASTQVQLQQAQDWLMAALAANAVHALADAGQLQGGSSGRLQALCTLAQPCMDDSPALLECMQKVRCLVVCCMRFCLPS